ncbi:MAG: flagellar export chaperone FlgN [Halanaerobiales bacterium]
MKDNLWQDFDRLLLKKLDLIQQLTELTRKQSGVIDEGELEELEKLIKRKNEIMDAVDQLDEHLNPILDEIRTFAGFNQDKNTAKIEEKGKLPAETENVLKDLRDLLLELQQMDQENLQKMNEKRAELGKRMVKIQSGRKANKGYHQDNRIYSTFIDKKG